MLRQYTNAEPQHGDKGGKCPETSASEWLLNPQAEERLGKAGDTVLGMRDDMLEVNSCYLLGH